MNEIILTFQNIFKSYTAKNSPKTDVLKGVSLEVERGSAISIVGPSGAGKSTLLHICGALDKPDSGSALFYSDDKEYNLLTMSNDALAEFRNKEIGFVFQFHHLLPEFSVLENVIFPALIAGVKEKPAKIKGMDLLDKVGLSSLAGKMPASISGGEQQRAAIARAMINDPKIIIADEPTGNLDAANANNVLELIHGIRKEKNLTFIMATHSDSASAMCDRIINIRDGKNL